MASPILDLGPCALIYNTSDLGDTFGDVIVRNAQQSRPILSNQRGITPIDQVIVGSETSVECALTRTAIADLAAVIPGAEASGSTLLKITDPSGIHMYDNSAELILKPIVDGTATADTNKWFHFPKSYPLMDLELMYNHEAQRSWKVVFNVFPDNDGGANDGLIAHIGPL